MATLEQRIECLFPSKKRKGPSPIAMVALLFAERRESWLTQDDLINLMNKKFSDSTVRKAFKKLSRPLNVSDGYSFIDTESVKKNGRGRPVIRGILSQAASEKIFALVMPVEQEPVSYFPKLNVKGRLEIPPLQIGDKYLPPEDIINRRIQKSGEKETRRLLRKMVNDIPGAKKEAKMVSSLAEKQGIPFDAANDKFYEGNQEVMPSGKLAEEHAKWKRLHGKEEPYAKPLNLGEIIKKHHIGPIPKQQYLITDTGLRNLASDENRVACSMTTSIVDTREDQARVLSLEERASKEEQDAFNQIIQLLLNDPGRYVRIDAAYALGRLNDSRAIEPLAKAMLNDDDCAVRSITAEKLGGFGYSEALIEALKDKDPHNRQVIVNILEKLRDTRATQPLIEVLNDIDPGVRCDAAIALGSIGDPRAVEPLRSMLEDENESVRLAADRALRIMGESQYNC